MIFFKLVICIILLFACNNIEKNVTNIVAKVGIKSLIINDFRIEYIDFLRKSGAKDNLLFRNKFLDKEIERLVVLSFADSIDLNKSIEVIQKINIAKKQKILNEFFLQELYNNYQATDSLLRANFVHSKTEFHVRHLYSRSIEGANNLKAKLNQGESFLELAKEVFQDSILSQNGGDLGYLSFGEMDPEFENIVFNLQDGQISEPIKTNQGYSIIQVIDRWIQPLITEKDFQLHKKEINEVLRDRNISQIKKMYTDSLIQSLKIYFKPKDLNDLFSLYLQNKINKIQTKEFEKIDFLTKFKSWHNIDIINHIENLSIRQKNIIHSKEDLLEAIKGIIVREKILSLSKNKYWFEDPNFQQKLIRESENILISCTVDYLKSNNIKHNQKNYFQFLIDYKKSLPIYINYNMLRNMIISS